LLTGECRDINECQLGTHTCHHSLRCDNTIGSYDCVRVQDCGTGYTINAETDSCEDIDECALNTHNCGQGFQCRNIQGSFKCDRVSCPSNYHLLNDGTCQINDCGIGKIFNETYNRCMDINECANNPCRASEKCINTVGSFRCTSACTPGYQLNKFGIINSCDAITSYLSFTFANR
jgi:fibulin 1/2